MKNKEYGGHCNVIVIHGDYLSKQKRVGVYQSYVDNADKKGTFALWPLKGFLNN